MSLQGRPKGEHRSAQHEGIAMSVKSARPVPSQPPLVACTAGFGVWCIALVVSVLPCTPSAASSPGPRATLRRQPRGWCCVAQPDRDRLDVVARSRGPPPSPAYGEPGTLPSSGWSSGPCHRRVRRHRTHASARRCLLASMHLIAQSLREPCTRRSRRAIPPTDCRSRWERCVDERIQHSNCSVSSSLSACSYWLAFRGVTLLLAAPIAAALVAAAFSGEPLLAKWTLTFMHGRIELRAEPLPAVPARRRVRQAHG